MAIAGKNAEKKGTFIMIKQARKLAQEGGDRYAGAIALNQEDFRLGIKYLLLRLTVAGLTRDEVAELANLARAAFSEKDITDEVNQIRNRTSSTSLALALANLVAETRGSKKMAIMGAVLGAHAGFGAKGGDEGDISAIHGAIVGAAIFGSDPVREQELEVGLDGPAPKP